MPRDLLLPLRRVRRRFLPAHVRQDIRDTELLVATLERELAPDADTIDAGAHAGVILEHLVRVAPRGRHVAFEPLPAMAAALARRFPQVDVHAAALGATTGERSFAHVVDEPGWSGFVARPTPSGGAVEELTVAVERIDDLDLAPAFIKLDVEGAEEEVLRGAAATLRRHRPLVALEHGRGSAEHHGSGPDSLHRLLADLGYELFGIDGDGPYDRARFGVIFAAGERVNFLARPVGA